MEPFDLVAVVPPWAKQPSNRQRRKPATASKKPDPGANTPDSEEKSEFVEVTAEGGDHVEPPPPEVVEPDPELSPEEAEQARKDYLLTRFWISARGYWGRNGDRLAWLFTIGLSAPDRRQCRLSIRHQCLESRDLRRHREARFRDRLLPCRGVLSARDRQRAARRGAGVHPHGHPAPLARLADECGDIALAGQRPLLSAQPRRRRSPESGIPHRRGFEDRDRLAGRFRCRRHIGIPVGRDLHRRALDHRRRADGDAGRLDHHHSRLPRHRRDRLRRDRLGLDHDDRAKLRAGVRGQEPGRGRISLCADARARERRKHRAARRRGGRARRHRQDLHKSSAAMGAARRPAHAHHAGVAGIEPDRARGSAACCARQNFSTAA